MEMNAPRDTATSSQEQDTNRSGQSLQQPFAGPYNAPVDKLLSVGDGESEQHGEHDSENEGEWPCICGDGLNTDGTWIRCDKSNCPFTWYHLACVGLKNAPPGKWVCPQCQARRTKTSKKTPGPKKRGIAMKAPQKEEPARWKGWRELPSDEEEQFKQNVESLWAAQITPGRTRRGAREDALSRENESEPTGERKSRRQQLRMDSSKQSTRKTRTRRPLETPYSEDEGDSTGEGNAHHQQLQMDGSKQSTGNRAYLGPPHNRDSGPSLQSESSIDDQNAWMSELIVGPYDMTTDDRAAPPEEDEPGSTDWETVTDGDDETASPREDEAESESTDRGTIMDGDDRAASPIEDESGSTDWETVMDEDDRAAAPGEDEPESADRDTVMEVEDIAKYVIDTARGSDHVSDDDSDGSSGVTTPKAADILPSVDYTTTGEGIDLEPTAGDQALVSALKGNWVGQYFA